MQTKTVIIPVGPRTFLQHIGLSSATPLVCYAPSSAPVNARSLPVSKRPRVRRHVVGTSVSKTRVVRTGNAHDIDDVQSIKSIFLFSSIHPRIFRRDFQPGTPVNNIAGEAQSVVAKYIICVSNLYYIT